MRKNARTEKGSVKRVIIITLLVLILTALLVWPARRYVRWVWGRLTGGATIAQRLDKYGPSARQRLKPCFDRAGIHYPPAKLVLIGIKDRKILEIWAKSATGQFVHVQTYPIMAASGNSGPKLRQGDRQVPEGIYRIESLHPNSMFHLALRVNYPNELDIIRAKADGRTNLGGHIMIHGSNRSTGCLAMGDQAAEELFVLVADTGLENTQLILTPTEAPESRIASELSNLPPWTKELYSEIQLELDRVRLR